MISLFPDPLVPIPAGSVVFTDIPLVTKDDFRHF